VGPQAFFCSFHTPSREQRVQRSSVRSPFPFFFVGVGRERGGGRKRQQAWSAGRMYGSLSLSMKNGKYEGPPTCVRYGSLSLSFSSFSFFPGKERCRCRLRRSRSLVSFLPFSQSTSREVKRIEVMRSYGAVRGQFFSSFYFFKKED